MRVCVYACLRARLCMCVCVCVCVCVCGCVCVQTARRSGLRDGWFGPSLLLARFHLSNAAELEQDKARLQREIGETKVPWTLHAHKHRQSRHAQNQYLGLLARASPLCLAHSCTHTRTHASTQTNAHAHAAARTEYAHLSLPTGGADLSEGRKGASRDTSEHCSGSTVRERDRVRARGGAGRRKGRPARHNVSLCTQ